MKKSVFLLAHYDDEFGIYQEIKDHVIKNMPLHIVYTTSASKDGRGNPKRENESKIALKKLGVNIEKDISFVGKDLFIPDLQLKNNFIPIFKELDKILSDLGEINKIYTLSYEGGHPDHDGINFICSRLVQKYNIENKAWVFPLYSGPGLFGSFFYLFRPLSSNGEVIRKKISWRNSLKFCWLMLGYKSQVKTLIGLFPFYVFHMIFKRSQILQKLNIERVKERPHAGKLLYERRNMDDYEKIRNKMNFFDSWYYSLLSKNNIKVNPQK